MASTSFTLSNPLLTRRLSSASPPATRLRISASYATETTLQTTSFYEVLGIQTGATCQEIKSAYRKLARVVHPDVSADASSDEFMRVHAAYTTLSDPDKRAVYDSTLFRRTLTASGFGGRRRSWETDQCW